MNSRVAAKLTARYYCLHDPFVLIGIMLTLVNPKQNLRGSEKSKRLYPYYAGFSRQFVGSILSSKGITSDMRVCDPWNGSGTTTSVSQENGFSSIGIDLNPAMVIIARAHMLGRGIKPSIGPIAFDIIERTTDPEWELERAEPLLAWFTEKAAFLIRILESNIQRLLVDETQYISIAKRPSIDCVSDLAAFFYVGLFRTIRLFLARFSSSNPTWVKEPSSDEEKVEITWGELVRVFSGEIEKMSNLLSRSQDFSTGCEIRCASSHNTLIKDASVDLTITSPPYCTRIDYAVATRPELAVLGVSDFQGLRRSLIGTSTVAKHGVEICAEWGRTCVEFLERVQDHPSKASNGYYLKNLSQYFDAIYRSINEISRISSDKSMAIIVAQDSYYKEIYNDLPRILVEMFHSYGFQLFQRSEFSQRKTMAGINPKIKPYRSETTITESVICLRR